MNDVTSPRIASLWILMRRLQIRTLVALGMVSSLVFAMSWLALTHDYVGPHLAFEFEQAQRALSGEYDSHHHFHYVHIWTLRSFFGLGLPRQFASALYAAFSSSALALLIYALGKRSSGPIVGVVAALIALSFAPLAEHWATPIRQVPSTLYAGLALLCAMADTKDWKSHVAAIPSGLLCFASMHCEVAGIAVWPVVLWLLASRAARSWNVFALFALGVVLGQAGLALVDGIVSGDFLQSMRWPGLRQALHDIGGSPWKRMGRNRLFREPFFGALVSLGTREILILGVLGIALCLRRSVVVQALAVWAATALPIVAWTINSSRSTAIFGVVLLTPALCVGTAHLLMRLWKQVGPEHDIVPGWMAIFVATLICVLSISGIQAHINHQWLDQSGYAAMRGDMFFFRLAIPLSLAAAALLRVRWLRAIPLAIALCALLLMGRSRVEENAKAFADKMKPWQTFADKVFQHTQPKVAIYYASAVPQHFRPSLVRNNLNLLAKSPSASIQIRITPSLSEIDSDEFLLIDYGQIDQLLRLTFSSPPPLQRYVTRIDYRKSMARVFLPVDAVL